VIELPVADPGTPDTRSPFRLLLWVAGHQRGTIAIAITFGILWMTSQALMPYAIGQAIQQGIVEGSNERLAFYCGLLAALALVQAVAGVMRHRYAVQNWLQAAYRLAQAVGHHAARSGDAVRAELSTGEVVATVSNDALRAGGAFDILARLAGGIVSYVVVAAILLATSPKLGLLVLLGVPILTLTLSVVIGPLQRRQREQREEVGKLTALGADTAGGLRVLRGVGGEQAFLARYRAQSESVRASGVRVAGPQSTLDAAQVLLPARPDRLPPDAARARGGAGRRRSGRAVAGAAARRSARRHRHRARRRAGGDDVPRLAVAGRGGRARRSAGPARGPIGGAARRRAARPAPARGGAAAHPRL
jgi:ABC-type multidrug transport system fused ATPase/permease subunit